MRERGILAARDDSKCYGAAFVSRSQVGAKHAVHFTFASSGNAEAHRCFNGVIHHACLLAKMFEFRLIFLNPKYSRDAARSNDGRPRQSLHQVDGKG